MMVNQQTLVVQLLLLAGVDSVYGLPQSEVKEGFSSRRDRKLKKSAIVVGNDKFTQLLHEVCDAVENNGWNLNAGLASLSFDASDPYSPTLLTRGDSEVVISFTKKSSELLDLDEILGLGNHEYLADRGMLEERYCKIQALCENHESLQTSSSIVRMDGEIVLPLSQGNVISEAPEALGSDHVANNYGIDGTGLKIGIISNSFDEANNPKTDYDDDVGNGELPDNVEILLDLEGWNDEGRAMAQLVYDMVPGASIAFRTGFISALDMANGITDMYDAGCNVIVDDVKYMVEPYFTDGIISQVATNIVNDGVAYFSSAGNQGRNSWEDTFTSTKDEDLGAKFNAWFAENQPEITTDFTQADFHDFGGGTAMQKVTGSDRKNSYLFILQWDEVWSSLHEGDPQTDLDFFTFWYDDVTGEVDIQRASMYDNLDSTMEDYRGDPYEYLVFDRKDLESDDDGGDPDVYLAIVKAQGNDGVRVKWIEWWNDIIDIEPTNGSFAGTVYGHQNAAGVAAVGAANYDATPEFNDALPGAQLEEYSSAGGVPILRDWDGNPIASETRGGTRFVGPDLVATTFFGSRENGVYRFEGTSAAAPNVAAVAIQMLQAKSDLTPADINAILESTAEDMLTRNLLPGQPDRLATLGVGHDDDSGAGFVKAEAALATICPAEVTVSLDYVTDEGNGETSYDIKYTLTSNCDLTLMVVDVTASSTCNGESVSLPFSTDTLRIKNTGGCSIQQDGSDVVVDAGDVTVTITAAFVDGSTLAFTGSASVTSTRSPTPGPTAAPTPGPTSGPTSGPTPGPAASPTPGPTPGTTTGGTSGITPVSGNLRGPNHWAYTRGGLRIYCKCQWCVCET